MVRSRSVTFVLILTLCLLTGAAAIEGYGLYRDYRFNQLLAQGGTKAGSEPLLSAAYANRLAERGQWQQAVRIYNQILPNSRDELKPLLHYNLGTLYLQEAARRWHKRGVWDYSRVVTLLGLAREHLREAVRLDPADLNARYNLEYALRIHPPPRERQPSKWRGHKQSVFATLPGMPKGGP